MGRKNFSKNISEFHEKFQGFHTFYSYHQKWLREQADKATETDDIMTSSVYNGKADELASVVSHVEILIEDFENLIAIGLIKKEA